jgi:hypothetical protein
MQPGAYNFELNLNTVIAISIVGLVLIIIIFILVRYGFKYNKVDGVILGKNEKTRFDEMYELLKNLKNELVGIRRDILRLNLISTENSIEERMDAGKRYIDAGGNGPASALYEKLKRDYQEGLM